MKDSSIKQRALGGVIWKFLEKIGKLLIQFCIEIVLARLLMPEDYGIVALITTFITVSDVVIHHGFTSALIQKKQADDIDYSSVFYANLFMAVVMYVILFIGAPFVADFYKQPNLVEIMRVLSLNILIGAFCAVHNSIMARRLEFRKSFFRNISNIITQGIVGITLAYMNFGVWALVYSKLAGTLVGCIVLSVTVKWMPKKMFSFKRLRSLFSYSSKVLGRNLLNSVFNNIHPLIIGKFFAKSELGYYQRGQQIPQVAMTAIDGSINEVMFPTLSKFQDDILRLKNALRRSMQLSMFVVLPAMCGLIVVAKPLTLILLTEKWLPSVPFMQLSCVVCMFWPLSARTHALNAIGRSDVTLKMTIIAKIITLIFIFICIRFGIYAIMLGSIFTSIVTMGITSHYVNKYIHYSFKELAIDLLPTVGISLLMMIVVYLISLFNLNIWITLCLQIVAGIFVYFGLARLFKFECLEYLLNILKGLIKK